MQIRIRFGSLVAFERAVGLPERSVTDYLRGRPNARVRLQIDQLLSPANQSANADDSSPNPTTHRLYEAAK